jgi:hypothetical protein
MGGFQQSMSWRTPFEPKLLTAWREGYGVAALRRDAIAGLTHPRHPQLSTVVP